MNPPFEIKRLGDLLVVDFGELGGLANLSLTLDLDEAKALHKAVEKYIKDQENR